MYIADLTAHVATSGAEAADANGAIVALTRAAQISAPFEPRRPHPTAAYRGV